MPLLLISSSVIFSNLCRCLFSRRITDDQISVANRHDMRRGSGHRNSRSGHAVISCDYGRDYFVVLLESIVPIVPVRVLLMYHDDFWSTNQSLSHHIVLETSNTAAAVVKYFTLVSLSLPAVLCVLLCVCL